MALRPLRVLAHVQHAGHLAEAVETLVCDIQDLTLLLGLGLNALVGWWWADPVAALGLIPFLIKEGREGLSGHHEHEA